MSQVKKLAALASVAGALAIAPGASAAPPDAQALNPPPPDGYTCKAVGGGTICTGSFPEDVSEPQIELVCGSGADAFLIHDNAHLDRRPRAGTTGTAISPAASSTTSGTMRVLEQPAERQDRPVHPERQDHRRAARAGRLRVRARDDRGQQHHGRPGNPQEGAAGDGTHRDRTPTASSSSARDKQPFLDTFVNGDMSVFDDVCAALA